MSNQFVTTVCIDKQVEISETVQCTFYTRLKVYLQPGETPARLQTPSRPAALLTLNEPTRFVKKPTSASTIQRKTAFLQADGHFLREW